MAKATTAKNPGPSSSSSVTPPPPQLTKTNPAAAYPPPVVPGSAPGAALPLADLSEAGWRAFMEEFERLLSAVIASGKWKAQQPQHHRGGGGGERGDSGGGRFEGGGHCGGLEDLLGASCPRF